MFSVKSISSQLLFGTVRIHAKGDGRDSVGTGFFFNFTVPGGDPNQCVPALITNKHVIEGMKEMTLLLHKGRSGPDGEPRGSRASRPSARQPGRRAFHWASKAVTSDQPHE